MDMNVQEAALWTEDEFNANIAYLEGAGLQEFADQAKSMRAKGKEGYEEWQRIEEAAAALPASELVQLGKGSHLLEDKKTSSKASKSTEASE